MIKLTETLIQQRLKVCTTDLEKVLKINITGRELQDVSLLRRMTGVEILSLSVNNISSLSDFQNCKNLRELYLRHNNIKDINEISYLKNLPKLELLMLSENPCADDPLYRMTVIKNLKHLIELDGTPITPEERKDSVKLGKDVFPCDDPLDHFGNCIPDGPQIQRTPTPSSQRLKTADTSFVELLEAKPHFETVNEDEDLFGRKADESKENLDKLDVPRVPSPCEMCGSKVMKPPVQPPLEKVCPRSAPPHFDLFKNGCQCKFCVNLTNDPALRAKYDSHHFRIFMKNSNILSATLNLIRELDYPSLQVINAEVGSRLNGYQLDYYCRPES